MNKIERAKPLSSMVESGNIFVVEREWTKDYLDELHSFPDGKHDDQVDASSGAFNALFGGSAYGGIYV
jgi:predicted phage terminase large subunit-like protein